MANGTLLYAQSGGVTAVLNATASAVIQAARARKVKVLAARNGILGALREELVDTSRMPLAAVRALAHTPGGAFGSCRVKLMSLEEDRARYERLIAVLRAHDVRWFLKHMATAMVPAIYDPTLADEDLAVSTEEAHRLVRKLATDEGLLVGISSGAALGAALTVARRLEKGVVVTVFPDGAEKYLSESFWTADESGDPA